MKTFFKNQEPTNKATKQNIGINNNQVVSPNKLSSIKTLVSKFKSKIMKTDNNEIETDSNNSYTNSTSEKKFEFEEYTNDLFDTLEQFMNKEMVWKGTATQLLEALTEFYLKKHHTRRLSRDFPNSPAALSRTLALETAELKELGISMFKTRTAKARIIQLNRKSV